MLPKMLAKMQARMPRVRMLPHHHHQLKKNKVWIWVVSLIEHKLFK